MSESGTMTTVEDLIALVRPRLGLEAEAEHEVLEEIRGHLEEAVAEAKGRGCDDDQALREAASAFGLEIAAEEIRATHAGWGISEGVGMAALPVVFALVLRWLIFAPDGTAVGWREMLTHPALVAVAIAALVVPALRFPRYRSAIALWAFLWGLSVLTAVWPTLRW